MRVIMILETEAIAVRTRSPTTRTSDVYNDARKATTAFATSALSAARNISTNTNYQSVKLILHT